LCLPHTGGSPSQLWFSPIMVGVYLDSGESPSWWECVNLQFACPTAVGAKPKCKLAVLNWVL
jgi:hypothetical protein